MPPSSVSSKTGRVAMPVRGILQVRSINSPGCSRIPSIKSKTDSCAEMGSSSRNDFQNVSVGRISKFTAHLLQAHGSTLFDVLPGLYKVLRAQRSDHT